MTRLLATPLLASLLAQAEPAPTLEQSVAAIADELAAHSRYVERDGLRERSNVHSTVSLDEGCVLSIETHRPQMVTTSRVPLAAVDAKTLAIVRGRTTASVLIDLKTGTPNVIRERVTHEAWAGVRDTMAPLAFLRVTTEESAKRIVSALERAVTICEEQNGR